MTESLKGQVVTGISTESTPASPTASTDHPIFKVSVGQQYKAKDKRRVSILTITEVPLMGNRVHGTSRDPLSGRTRRVTILVPRLLSKFNRIA